MTRYLLELTLRNPATGTDTVLRLTERSSYTTRPTDTPSQAWYRPYAQRLCNYEIDLFAGGRAFGGGGGSVGEALLNNASRWLDPYQTYAWRSARLLEGPLGRFVSYAEFTPILNLAIAGRDYIGDEVSVRFADTASIWGRTIPRQTYAGTNSGPVGLEGNADLTGRVKPLVIGFGLGVPVEWANPSLLIAQWHAGPTDGAVQVSTGGYPVNIAGDVGAAITNPSLSIAADKCVTDNARGLVRFGSTPPRKVTVDGVVLAIPSVSACAAQLASLIGATDPISLSAGFGDQNMGYLPGSGATAADVLDVFARSCGAWWRVDTTRTLRGGPVPDLTGSAAFTLSGVDVPQLDVTSSGDDWGDVPIWRVEVPYSRNWTPLTEAEIDPSISSPVVRGYLLKQWRFEAAAENPATLAMFPDAQVLRVESVTTGSSNAVSLANRLLALHGVPRVRRLATVTSRISPGQMPLGRIGQLVRPGQPTLKFIHTGTSTEDGRTFQLRMFG